MTRRRERGRGRTRAQSRVVKLTMSAVLQAMQWVRLPPSLRPKRRALPEPHAHLPPHASSGFLERLRLTMPATLHLMQFVRADFFLPSPSTAAEPAQPKRFTFSEPQLQSPVDGRRLTSWPAVVPSGSVPGAGASLHSTQCVAGPPGGP